MSGNYRRSRGFTIVELLIVIVVIAILAALVMVTYNGMQQRARNAARLVSAEQAVKTLTLLAAEQGVQGILAELDNDETACYGKVYPDVNSDGLGDCRFAGTTTYDSNNTVVNGYLEGTGSYGEGTYLPMTAGGATFAGPAILRYDSTIDGRPGQLQLVYYLEGVDQDCTVGSVLTQLTTTTFTLAGAKNSASGSGMTICIIDLSSLE